MNAPSTTPRVHGPFAGEYFIARLRRFALAA
jgi:hypothetical protein